MNGKRDYAVTGRIPRYGKEPVTICTAMDFESAKRCVNFKDGSDMTSIGCAYLVEALCKADKYRVKNRKAGKGGSWQ